MLKALPKFEKTITDIDIEKAKKELRELIGFETFAYQRHEEGFRI